MIQNSTSDFPRFFYAQPHSRDLDRLITPSSWESWQVYNDSQGLPTGPLSFTTILVKRSNGSNPNRDVEIQSNQNRSGLSGDLSQMGAGEQLLRVSQLAKARLIQISRNQTAQCIESYLFQNDLFCGLRYRLGPFVASWFASENVIRFFRNAQPIGVIELQPASSKAA